MGSTGHEAGQAVGVTSGFLTSELSGVRIPRHAPCSSPGASSFSRVSLAPGSALECSGNRTVQLQRLLNAFSWDYL